MSEFLSDQLIGALYAGNIEQVKLLVGDGADPRVGKTHALNGGGI